MDSKRLTALDEIKNCINNDKSFVLQGGAGSGKTETLTQTLEFISENHPQKKIACITHTNLAVEEIKSRVKSEYTVISTIHSFINGLIKNYKKNIHQVIYKLFELDLMERQGIEHYENEKEQKKKEHEKYKKIHNKYASSLFTVMNERAEKVEGKRDYDKNPEGFNESLNAKINALNFETLHQIQEKDCSQIHYNETRFNNFHDLSFGHDGLLEIAYLLYEKYPILGKILQDKFDYIFIDEYQDTREIIIDIFVNKLPDNTKTLIGLFGDSMQAIYSDGIGDVKEYVDNGTLVRIDKEDNYRSSQQVKDFINQLRNDGLVQEVALREGESINDRQGDVTLYYAIYENKPHKFSSQEDKDRYIEALDSLIAKATEEQGDFVQLKLTNKSIASDVGFPKLFDIFSDRYIEPLEEIDKHLESLQYAELATLCTAYRPLKEKESPNYNLVLSWLKKQGLSIKSIADKKKIKEAFDKIIDSNVSAFQTLNEAFALKLLGKSQQHLEYLERKDSFLNELKKNEAYIEFKNHYLNGGHTWTKIKKNLPHINQVDFKEREQELKKEIFYERFFSNELSFKEIMNYFHYLNKDIHYITMHKTKGTGIDNVLVVLNEYFWSEYDFKVAFSEEGNLEKKHKNQKLVYVACSRAKTNLRCVRLVSSEEEESEILRFFEKNKKFDLTELL